MPREASSLVREPVRGLEPLTTALQERCAASCATPAGVCWTILEDGRWGYGGAAGGARVSGVVGGSGGVVSGGLAGAGGVVAVRRGVDRGGVGGGAVVAGGGSDAGVVR